MPKSPPDKRTRLIQTAVKLSYANGFTNTSIADIAKDADVPLGNVYYYFKTKEELADAIIEQRMYELQQLREQWQKSGSPKERLIAFIRHTRDQKNNLVMSGCPIGRLCSEFSGMGEEIGERSSMLFQELLTWLEKQFLELGKKSEARKSAVHLLSALQGVAVLSNSLKNSEMIAFETAQLEKWIATL